MVRGWKRAAACRRWRSPYATTVGGVIALMVIYVVVFAVSGCLVLVGLQMRDVARRGDEASWQRFRTYTREARSVFGMCIGIGGSILGYQIAHAGPNPRSGPTGAVIGLVFGCLVAYWLDNRFDF